MWLIDFINVSILKNIARINTDAYTGKVCSRIHFLDLCSSTYLPFIYATRQSRSKTYPFC